MIGERWRTVVKAGVVVVLLGACVVLWIMGPPLPARSTSMPVPTPSNPNAITQVSPVPTPQVQPVPGPTDLHTGQ